MDTTVKKANPKYLHSNNNWIYVIETDADLYSSKGCHLDNISQNYSTARLRYL